MVTKQYSAWGELKTTIVPGLPILEKWPWIALQTVVCRTPVSPVIKLYCTLLGFIHFEQWI